VRLGGILIIRMLMIFSLLVAGAQSAGGAGNADEPRTVEKKDSIIEFHAKATFAKIVGVFHEWDADLTKTGSDFGDARLKIKIDSNSVSTGSGMKDKEIKNKNFFDVKTFPEIILVSTKVTPGPDPTKFVMEGNMTMRGITKPVTVMIVQHPVAKGHQMIDGEIQFNRRDFGMTHNVPFNKVSNEVEVEFHLNVVSGGAAAAEK
jgi:polyisoprenoid-binding protein YceI